MQFLDKIIAHQRQLVTEQAKTTSVEKLKESAEYQQPCRGFINSLHDSLRFKSPALAFIAEIKKASPSAGLIRKDFSPPQLAKSYQEGGAACLSVLTNSFFQGENKHLQQAREAVDIPVLRKDFIIDEYQIHESRSLGADAILLIVACLDEATLQKFYALGVELGMDVLVEAHTLEEADMAEKIGASLIGVNNRNLKTFEVDLYAGGMILSHLQDKSGSILVAESGIHDAGCVKILHGCGAKAFLVGEKLMRAEDPGYALKQLISQSRGI